MNSPDRNRISPPSLCTKCGTCLYICPEDALSTDSEGFPKIREEDCSHCGLCGSTCPGWGLDFTKLEDDIHIQGKHDQYVGGYSETYLCRAKDDVLADFGSSGGVVSAILIYLFQKGLIDAALVVGTHPERPWQAYPIVITSEEDISKSQQSKYSSCMLNSKLQELLEYDRVAVVGKPCDIQGIRLLSDRHLHVKEKLVIAIGIYCGFGHVTREGSDFLVQKLGLDKDSITEFSFRSGSYPGGIQAEDGLGNKAYIPKDEYKLWNPLFMLPRCLYCIDFTAELADISIGDAFSLSPDKRGWATVITRTDAGKQLFARAREGELDYKAVTVKDIVDSQIFLASFKKEGAFMRMRQSRNDEVIQYVTRTGGVETTGLIFTIKQRIITTVFLYRSVPISLFKLLPFKVFRMTSKYFKRA